MNIVSNMAQDEKPVKYHGTIQGGVVVLESPPIWDEGTRVQVEQVETPPAGATLGQRLQCFSGAARSLPKDMAAQHNHYLHGRPKA